MALIGDRIRQLREEKKWTLDQLSKATDISKGFLSDVENSHKNISSQGLLKIANALDASVDYLLRGEVSEAVDTKPLVIPPELNKAAVELNLSYLEMLELLDAYRSVVARRSNRQNSDFTVEDWKGLRNAIKEVFG
jgi:transcriptional regulator with XRE-family HTH domain